MNTFLPYPSFYDSARALDRVRLRNQLNECKVIMAALGGAKAWNRHPAVLMWKGYEASLQGYMCAVADVMLADRIPVPRWAPHGGSGNAEPPPWLGAEVFHTSHRRNLVRKDPNHYGKLFPDVTPSDVYCWPTLTDAGWVLRFKKVGASIYDSTEQLLECATT